MIQLVLADTSISIKNEVDVMSLLTLNENQVKWVTRIVIRQRSSDTESSVLLQLKTMCRAL